MANTNREPADFLRRARAQGDPTRPGLPADDRVRRVPGLRREEVARLAGVSTDYCTRLEQGRRITPSTGVLDAIARALGLDTAGRAHLGRRTDVLAVNRMGKALLTDFDALRPRDRNHARWMVLSDQARALFLDWDTQARAAVENLRLDVGDDPGDTAAADLTAHSAEFRRWWAEHRVHQRTFGTKRLRHPSSATSPSTTRPSPCPATPTRPCSCSPPNPPAPLARP